MTDAASGPEEETPSWLENPRFSLESLSPGQRYTAVIVAALIACMLAFGTNRNDSAPSASGTPVAGASSGGPQSGGGAGGTAGTSGGSAGSASPALTTGGAAPGPQAAVSGARVASGAGSATPGGTGAPASGSGTASTSSGGATSGTMVGAAPSGGNGGATAPGVTGSRILIGMANEDTSTFGAACPRCGNGDAANGAADKGLVAAWKKDGLDTVYGRQIELVDVKYNVLNAEEQRNACESVAADHPFVVAGDSLGASGGGIGQCLIGEHKLPIVDGLVSGDHVQLGQLAPYAWQTQPTADTVWANFPLFLDKLGMLKGQTLCLYSPDDSGGGRTQEDLDASFRAQLHRMGYKLAVDITYGSAPNDALAVEQFRSRSCSVAFIIGTLTEPAGFQNVAEQQGYRPKYPIAEYQVEMSDAVADVTYNANAEDGNVGMHTNFFEWAKRNPVTPLNNQAAAYCINAYEAYTHKTLDVYTNDSEIRYSLNICSALQIVRQALINAGPNLTLSSFVAGMEKIQHLQVAGELSVSFGPGKHAGGDLFVESKFNRARWQPANDYWGVVGQWAPFYLGPWGA